MILGINRSYIIGSGIIRPNNYSVKFHIRSTYRKEIARKGKGEIKVDYLRIKKSTNH